MIEIEFKSKKWKVKLEQEAWKIPKLTEIDEILATLRKLCKQPITVHATITTNQPIMVDIKDIFNFVNLVDVKAFVDEILTLKDKYGAWRV